MAQKRSFNEGKRHFKSSKKQKTTSDGSNEAVLRADVQRLLPSYSEPSPSGDGGNSLPAAQTEIELNITELSSTGDGLAVKDGRAYVVPFTAPGDVVLAKVYLHHGEEAHTLTDFVRVLTSSPHRTETPKCPYFTKCSGCQFQFLPYSYQLAHKRHIVEKAYQNFSGLPPSSVPAVGDTIGSPLQYGYRTKLTPHFDGPPGSRRDKRQGKKVTWPEVPPIGYMLKGTRRTLDIEDCPIGTDAVREGLKRERKRVADELENYQKGATLLLRESTERIEKDGNSGDRVKDEGVIESRDGHMLYKKCITDSRHTSTEYVDDFRFDNPAGAFFQNNNSILPLVTQYIRDHILGPPTPSSSDITESGEPKINNLIDAYCGSGFFTVTLSSLFTNSIGIDISAQSIISASTNAKLNNLPGESTRFIAADANDLFASVSTVQFNPSQTVVVIDPPRKGCDEDFINQLMKFGPARICYVSCNVHTQARDVGLLVGNGRDNEGLPVPGLYEIESLRGFDFFPQTGHVEGVAMLRRRRLAGDQGDDSEA